MAQVPGAQEFIPPDAKSLGALRTAVQECRGCDLYRNATQAVFGQGAVKAKVVMVGEQPGDVEDKAGVPFVGPAGKLLARAIDEAGYDPAEVYLTNAVKHFKFREDTRGKRRIHQSPARIEIVACRPWLVAEFQRLDPDLIVVLGSIAAQAILGPAFRVTKQRGVLLPWPESAHVAADFSGMHGQVLPTVHPSSVLRSDDRQAAYEQLTADLAVGAAALKTHV